MKQLIDNHSDIDTKISLKKLLPLTALGLAAIASAPAIAANINDIENNNIITAMYGFQSTKYTEVNSHTDDAYAEYLVQSIYGEKQGPDYSDESVYVDLLIKSVEGTSRPNAPDFSNEEVYVNYLVEIIMK